MIQTINYNPLLSPPPTNYIHVANSFWSEISCWDEEGIVAFDLMQGVKRKNSCLPVRAVELEGTQVSAESGRRAARAASSFTDRG